MKEIANFIINFTTNGGMLYVIIGLFLIGFGVKTAGSLCYDDILDKIGDYQIRKSKRAESIILQYENEVKFGKSINNIHAYVERSMHGWKIKGILVEKMQDIGDIFGKICLILGICAVAILLAAQKDDLSFGSQMTKGIYIYAAVAAILFICLKLWDNIIALEYKRNVIRDEIINYLDNNHGVDGKYVPAVSVEMKEPLKEDEADAEGGKIKTEETKKNKEEQNGKTETIMKTEPVKKVKRNSKNKRGKKNVTYKNSNQEKENPIIDKKDNAEKIEEPEQETVIRVDINRDTNKDIIMETADDKELEKIFDEVLEEFLS